MKVKKRSQQKPPDSIRLPMDLKEQLIRIAATENRSLSNVIITILKQWLDKFYKEHKKT